MSEIQDIVQNIKSNYMAGAAIPELKNCDSNVCEKFVEATGLTATDFALYNAFIDAAIDPMISSHKNDEMPLVGYSLSTSFASPFGKELYEKLMKIVFELVSEGAGENSYTALTVAGMEGFFFLSHNGAKASASYTSDFGTCQDEPAFDQASFNARVVASMTKIQQGYVTPASRLLSYCLEATQEAVPENLFAYFVPRAQKLAYSTPKLLGVFGFDYTQEAGFYASEDETYSRVFAGDNRNIAQSSCRTNMTKELNSDYRIVGVEKSFNGSMSGNVEVADFYDKLRTYPFRTENTVSLVAADNSGITDGSLQKCTSITDSSGICNCADPMAPTNWWVVSLSLILIAATVVVWIFGYKFAAQEEQKAAFESDAEL